MKKLAPFLISCLLVIGATACQNPSRTSADAPNDTNEAAKAPDTQATEAALNDAQDQTRRNQLNADIRANEQRNNQFNDGKATNRNESALASEVRSKLEANIPNGHLTVEASKEGAVTVNGTVTNQQQLAKIEPLAKQIKGVKSVNNKATVAQEGTQSSEKKTQ
ncbi:BON domain-containing protein [Brasilonema sp. UFV-L1]|uniref:BON domain-containing protein n=1 Tax=Brasilonema sp. UFV-L1 TaxID=2234130 RepID=UPI00145DC2C4|nr:BON domain-containing protein [Brasilonema sp. UFV-L1]NMG06751.1 transporter [Brasilonema sp. UFV-L1]